MQAIEFGYCRKIYGCLGQTATEVYLSSRFKGLVSVVSEGSNAVNFCDIAIVDTVATFLACKTYFNSDMIAIICDSSTKLSNLKSVTPYDYEGNLFNEFSLKPPLKSLFSAKSDPVKIELASNDLVLEAVKDIISASVLSEFNAITARMNSPARKILRAKLVALIYKQTSVEDIANFIAGINLDGETFIRALHSKTFQALSNAVVYYVKGHSIEYVTNQFGVSDPFEVTYFARMTEGDK